jgi:hypothetical protein
MVRKLIDRDLKNKVFLKFTNKCYVCGFSIKEALRVHHKMQVSYGGKDIINNLILLCSNCHSIIHFCSSNRFKADNIKDYLCKEYSDESIAKILKIAGDFKKIKDKIKSSNNLWTSENDLTYEAYSLDSAIKIISEKNKFLISNTIKFEKVINLIINNIPDKIKSNCSYRLIKGGKYISINIMNYLIFRSPGYPDMGGKPSYDCFIIFPDDILSLKDYYKSNLVFEFKNFECVMLGLSFDDIINLSDKLWKLFKEGCIMAFKAIKSKSWVSNIKIAH